MEKTALVILCAILLNLFGCTKTAPEAGSEEEVIALEQKYKNEIDEKRKKFDPKTYYGVWELKEVKTLVDGYEPDIEKKEKYSLITMKEDCVNVAGEWIVDPFYKYVISLNYEYCVYPKSSSIFWQYKKERKFIEEFRIYRKDPSKRKDASFKVIEIVSEKELVIVDYNNIFVYMRSKK